jgi:serine/threonine-protein kinase
VLRVGRYVLFGEIASGGMATVHYGRVRGAGGFKRVVAVKRLHPHLVKDEDFSTMFLDEARIAARVHHPNVANILDVVSLDEGELLLVMEYIAGESVSRLMRTLRDDHEAVPVEIAAAIACDALQGLHAAHEAKNDRGEALGIVHRDVSPHNLLVGSDGITRVIDFGIAKARGRIHTTQEGQVKGKLAYMPPEQLRGQGIDRRCDLYALGVVLWEMLTGQRLFLSDSEGETAINVLERKVLPPSQVTAKSPKSLDAVVLKALARDPSQRYATARDMAAAIEAATPVASARKVASWIETVAGHVLAERQRTVAELDGRPESELSAIGTPAGVEVRSSEDASQISSVSMPAGPPRATRRVAIVSVALLAVAGLAFGVVKLRPKAAPPDTSREVIASGSVSTTAVASTTIAAATTPIATASVSVTIATAAATAPRHPRERPAVTATASSDKPCPVKTFVDSDGIVQFRRECAP